MIMLKEFPYGYRENKIWKWVEVDKLEQAI